MLTAYNNKKIHSMHHLPFTKYATVTAIPDKNAKTVAYAIFKEWFCKFRILVQIHTNSGKEFINKLAAELFSLFNISHTKTLPAHPQYNAQVKMFNKSVKNTWHHS
jgi:hypothetical protein